MISEEYLDAEYFGNMTQLFQAAYHRDFTKQEMLRCKTMFPKAIAWYASFKPHQREAVDVDACTYKS
ncbi:MAG: hypothetical protein GY705_02360 [Bacteroidetes bacterium]|nr:hypothetical protein [Bacteroidota bacterium]